ncbi:MAG: alpha/beta hydrolase [Spirochaetia bacterium]|nr:alpha/beta hydrolase [Spirochaetota bacterium]MCX8096115.1 alpha/beta hydrolase [Spirochaetota bacterium]MDW8113069.1 alpha/beta hydrolase [Spirochaetia bacterium]
MVIVILLMVILYTSIISCTPQKLDLILVFNPKVKDEYDFSEIKAPQGSWSFFWITNGSVSTCAFKINRKTGINDDLSNVVVVFLHGNRTCLDDSPVYFGNMFYELGINYVAVEYRGFGIIKNFTPTEQSTYEDAEAIIAHLSNQGINPTNITIIGHSLGGGIATEMALRHKIKSLILISTFTKIEDAGEMVTTYNVPSRWYVESIYDNISKIDKIQDPLLVIHGKVDTTLSIDYGIALYNKAKEPKDYLWIENCNHSSKEIINKGGDELRNKIVSFLRNH